MRRELLPALTKRQLGQVDPEMLQGKRGEQSDRQARHHEGDLLRTARRR